MKFIFIFMVSNSKVFEFLMFMSWCKYWGIGQRVVITTWINKDKIYRNELQVIRIIVNYLDNLELLGFFK